MPSAFAGKPVSKPEIYTGMWAIERLSSDAREPVLEGYDIYCSVECFAKDYNQIEYAGSIAWAEQWPLGAEDPVAYPFESDRSEWCTRCGKRCNLGDECDGDEECAGLMGLSTVESDTAWICKHGYLSRLTHRCLMLTWGMTPRAVDLENKGLGEIVVLTHRISPGLFKFRS